MLNLFDKKVEKRVLALLLKSPTHMRALSLSEDSFAIKEHKEFFSILKKYIAKYRSAPSISALELYANDLLAKDNAESLLDALEVGADLPKVQKAEAQFYFDKLEDYTIGRGLYDLGASIKESIEEGASAQFRDVRKEIMSKVLSLGSNDGHIHRGFFSDYEEANRRLQTYKEINSKVGNSDVIPFGIQALDEALGGMRKTFVTMLYSKTGGGKTRTMMNLAYNAAEAGYNVMYFTLEMSFDLIASCFDSCIADVDSQRIIFGGLGIDDKKKYVAALRKQIKNRLNIWLVDIPSGATMAKIFEEIEVYIGANGVNPDLIAIDYSHLVSPIERGNDRSTKFDNLFKEIHEGAKYYNSAILTAAPESRSKSKLDAKKVKGKHEDEEEGTHNIGASNFMAFHCETIIRLQQNAEDRLHKRLWAIPDKCRYGRIGDPLELYADWATTLVRDPIHSIVTKVPSAKSRKAKNG